MSKAWRQRMRNEGRCIDCGGDTMGHSRCPACQAKASWTPAKSRAQRAMIVKRRQRGECARCRATSKKFYRCLECRLFMADWFRRRREKLKHAA